MNEKQKETDFNIGTWDLKTVRKTLKLENLTSKMEKCELNVAGLSQVKWSGKGAIVPIPFW